MAKKIALKPWTAVLKTIGAANIVFILLIATPLHDLGTISIVLTLVGLFVITIFILKSKLYILKFSCVIGLLTYYAFFTVYGLGYLGLSIVMQKVYNISSMLLVLGLEYFTRNEDFRRIKWGRTKVAVSR